MYQKKSKMFPVFNANAAETVKGEHAARSAICHLFSLDNVTSDRKCHWLLCNTGRDGLIDYTRDYHTGGDNAKSTGAIGKKWG